MTSPQLTQPIRDLEVSLFELSKSIGVLLFMMPEFPGDQALANRLGTQLGILEGKLATLLKEYQDAN